MPKSNDCARNSNDTKPCRNIAMQKSNHQIQRRNGVVRKNVKNPQNTYHRQKVTNRFHTRHRGNLHQRYSWNRFLFNTKNDLHSRQYKKVCTTPKSFDCPLCHEPFRQRRQQLQHIERYHRNEKLA